MSAQVDFSSLCKMCLRSTRIEGKKICRCCDNQRQRERYHARKRRGVMDRKDPNLCNCGNRTCNGLSCEVVRP